MTLQERHFDPYIPCVKYQRQASSMLDGTNVIYIAEERFLSSNFHWYSKSKITVCKRNA